MAVADIRIALSFRHHRKLQSLIRAVGIGATHYLVCLWSTAAETRPDGRLTGWDAADLADACQWDGRPETLAQALVRGGWIEENNGVFALHDWHQHQGWVVGHPARQESARKAARAKWDATRMRSASDAHEAPEPTPDAQGVASEFMADGDINHAPRIRRVCDPQCAPHNSSTRSSSSGGDATRNAGRNAPSPIIRSSIDLPGKSIDIRNSNDIRSGFALFWTAYPKKRSKGDAVKAWEKATRLTTPDTIMAGLTKAKKSEDWRKDDGRFIPYPGTWLNRQGWEDDYAPIETKPYTGRG